MVQIEVISAVSSATVEFKTGIDGTFHYYKILFEYDQGGAAHNGLDLSFSINAGSSWLDTGGRHSSTEFRQGNVGGTGHTGLGSQNTIKLFTSFSGDVVRCGGEITVFDPLQSSRTMAMWGVMFQSTSTLQMFKHDGGAINTDNRSVNAFRLRTLQGTTPTGNMNGTFTLYGIS